ncbi:MAG TPA: glycosyltransferase family 4 protein, partial [Solirubrobacteraceae bacterium]
MAERRYRRARRERDGGELGVLMVTNAVMPDQLGGLQRYVRELAGAIVARGVPVTVLAKRVVPESPRYERADDGVEIRRFDVPERGHPLYAAAYPLASLRAVARTIRATHRLVHVHYPLQGVPAAVLGVPYLHTFHAPIHRELLPEHQDRYALPSALRRPLVGVARMGERLVAQRARTSIVLTTYMRDQLAGLSPAAAERAVMIPAGIDGDHFSPGPGIEHAAAQNGGPLL